MASGLRHGTARAAGLGRSHFGRFRGGKDTLNNLVCASFFYNRKKLNNGADVAYLLRDGRPTEEYLFAHGALPSEQAQLLRRHATIIESDWYFNRAIFNLRVSLQDEWAEFAARRGAVYWQKAALRRILAWQKHDLEAGTRSFTRRGLVRYPNAPDEVVPCINRSGISPRRYYHL